MVDKFTLEIKEYAFEGVEDFVARRFEGLTQRDAEAMKRKIDIEQNSDLYYTIIIPPLEEMN